MKTSTKIIMGLVALFVLGVLLFSLKGNTNSQSSVSSVGGRTIEISNFAFSPAVLNVKIGEKVSWVNKDSASHTVTSDSGNELSSETLEKGQTYEHTFEQLGTFEYHCAFHPGMKAKIIVS